MTVGAADHFDEVVTHGPLARLIARSEIDRVLADWVHGIDGRDEVLWLGVFHHDAVFEVDSPAASATGHDAILAWVRDPWRLQTITHITGAHRIDFVNDCKATGVGRGVGIFKLEDGSVMLTTGKLEDHFLKRGGLEDSASQGQHHFVVSTGRRDGPHFERRICAGECGLMRSKPRLSQTARKSLRSGDEPLSKTR